jgi:SAM-dependent methyltransferase
VVDPFGGRQPTGHERRSGVPWDASYQDGPAPWEVGGPQPAVARLVADGAFRGAVLDAGCGSGDNALCVAATGLPVLGFDVAGTALAGARRKAAERGITAEFVVADALRLDLLGRTFDTVLDCGLLHGFDDDERPRYVAGLASVTEPGATLYVLCFSDEGQDTGPHPLGRADLTTAFRSGTGWTVTDVRPDRLRTRYHDAHGAPAWLATVTRSPAG